MKKLSFKNSFVLLTAAILVISGFFIAANANALTTLTVVTPNGGEEQRGIQNITWISTGGVSGDLVDITVIDEALGFSHEVATNVPFTASPFSWTTGTEADGSNYKIRILKAGTIIVYDTSDAVFMIDNTAPTTTYAIAPITPDGLNGWYVSVPTITLTCNDGAGSGCNNIYYKWDDAGSYTLYVGSFSALEGEHTLSFYSDDQAVDALGAHNLEIVQTKTIKVDTIAPTAGITYSKDPVKAGNSLLITATFNEAMEDVPAPQITISGANSAGPAPMTKVSSTVYTYTYTVGAGDGIATVSLNVGTDVAGNIITSTPTSGATFIVDNIAPTLAEITTVPTPDNDNTPDYTFSSDEAGTIGYAGGCSSVTISALASNNTITFNTLADGTYGSCSITVTDAAGNPSAPLSVSSFVIDTANPIVNAGTDKNVKALVSQDADVSDPDPSSGGLIYVWTEQSGPGTILFSALSTIDTDISVTDVSPAGDGTYVLRLTATDAAGNNAFDEITFIWDTVAPNQPIITSIAGDNYINDSEKGSVHVVGTAEAGSTISVTLTDSALTTVGPVTDVATGGSYDITLDATMLADGTITPSVTATDTAGNTSVAAMTPTAIKDIVAPTVLSITTKDNDTNSSVDTATIVFDEAMKDSSFGTGSAFSIGGLAATTFASGIADDDTVDISNGGVAGTEVKDVLYTPGTVTDLAGNPLAAIVSGTIAEIDEAGPVLISAKTVTTTTLEATFSEDLKGSTVNPSGSEFAVSGTIVTHASETTPGVVTLTYAPALGTGATPSVTFTNIGTFSDLIGNEAVTPTTVVASDGVPPILTAVSITSDNVNPIYAMEDDTVTLSFTSSEPIAIPTVMIQEALTTTVTDIGGGTLWITSRVMLLADTQGPITFSIAFEDISPAANDGATVTAVTDASSVFFDSVNPLVNAGDDKEVNAIVSQDATVSDPTPSSGGLIYEWVKISGSGSITFGTPAVEDTTISADTDGTYVIRLTVTDNAGNVTSDELTFIWDTVNPEPLTSSPSDGLTGVSISSSTATVTFDEDIVLLNGSRVLLVNDTTGASYKSAVSVSGGDSASAILNIDYSGLAYGTKYRVNVKSNALRDVAGNNLVLNFISYFTTEIDAVPPVVNSSSASSITTTGATLNVTTNESATCRYAATDSAYTSMTPFATTGGTSHTNALTGLSSSTGYDFYVRCADTSAQANEMTTSAHVSFTTLTPDTTAPEITNIQASATDTGGTITWTTDELATSRVEYGLASEYGTLTPADGTADLTSHSVMLSGLTPGAVYHFRVLSIDASSNAGVSGDNTFTTTDTTTPAVPVFTTASATTDADNYTLAGTVANDGGNRTISVYNGATLAGTTVVPTGLTSWSLLVPLTQDSANIFTATASDVAGNTSVASSSITITESTTLGDTTVPETPAITTSSATVDADTYTIEGTAGADLPSDGSRTIAIYNNGVVMGSIVLLSGETNWSFVASLNQEIENVFIAKSTDESGNTSDSSNSVTITEETSADTTAPVTSNIQANSIGIATATITWTTDETSTSQVEYGLTSAYGANTDMDSAFTTSHSVIVSGLTSNTVYHFRVKSTDALSNVGISDDNTFKTSVDDSTAILEVTNISSVNAYARDNNSFTDGWKWIFDVTVPTDETKLQMKFDDWVSGGNTIPAADNIRFYSEQSSDANSEGTAILVAGAGEWTSLMTLSDTDIDTTKAGRQIQITVQAKVPVGSALGSYSTSYGIQSL